MKKILILLLLFIPLFLSAQTTGRLPYKTIQQIYQGDTCLTTILTDSVKYHTNNAAFIFDKTIKVNNDTLASQGYARAHGSGGGGLVDTLTKIKSIYQAKLDTTKLYNQIITKQPQLSGTGFIKASGTTISYDNSSYATTTTVGLLQPDSITYNTAFPFNKTLTYMSHTLTANDVITVNATGAINQGGGQILFINNTSYTPDFSAYLPHVVGSYDNTKTYSLCTFIKVYGIYIVSILNVN
jgi:hypothetical protein